MPVIQYLTFPASETFLKDRIVFEEALETIAATEGHISSFYGVQDEAEGGKDGYFISVWESYKHHKRLMTSEKYASIIASLKPAIAGEIVRHHIEVEKNPDSSLSARTTEFAIITLKEGCSKEQLVTNVSKMIDALDEHERTYFPTVYGESLEQRGLFIMVVGWDSRAAHFETVSAERYQAIIGDVKQLATVSITHSDLTKYNG